MKRACFLHFWEHRDFPQRKNNRESTLSTYTQHHPFLPHTKTHNIPLMRDWFFLPFQKSLLFIHFQSKFQHLLHKIRSPLYTSIYTTNLLYPSTKFLSHLQPNTQPTHVNRTTIITSPFLPFHFNFFFQTHFFLLSNFHRQNPIPVFATPPDAPDPTPFFFWFLFFFLVSLITLSVTGELLKTDRLESPPLSSGLVPK